MAQIYLEPGFKFDLRGGSVRVGASGTVVDAVLDWGDVLAYCGVEDGVGSFTRCGDTFSVYLEEDTGKLWFDDEFGY